MNTTQKLARTILCIGILILQVIAALVVTFLVSLVFPSLGDKPGVTYPIPFAFLLSLTFTMGVFLMGWLAISFKWLKITPRLLSRLLGGYIGAVLPLFIGLLIYRALAPGNPFFVISVFFSIAGFYLGGMDSLHSQGN